MERLATGSVEDMQESGKPKFGQSGQAAITDALYFMLIVTGLCVFLFGFANTYGNNANQQFQSNYHSDFATDSMKTMLYSSIPRDVEQTLYDESSNAEIDYLLAYIKEDYSDDGSLSMETRTVLADNIGRILAPIKDNFDYMFIIRLPPPSLNNEFIYIFFKKTNFVDEREPNTRFPKYVPVRNNPGDNTDPSDGNPSTKDNAVSYYLCGLGKQVEYSDLDNALLLDISRVVGSTNQVSSKVLLARSNESGFEEVNNGDTSTPSSAFPDFKAQTFLTLWNATVLKDKASNHPNYFREKPWCCVEIEDFKVPPDVSTLDGSCNPTSPD